PRRPCSPGLRHTRAPASCFATSDRAGSTRTAGTASPPGSQALLCYASGCEVERPRGRARGRRRDLFRAGRALRTRGSADRRQRHQLTAPLHAHDSVHRARGGEPDRRELHAREDGLGLADRLGQPRRHLPARHVLLSHVHVLVVDGVRVDLPRTRVRPVAIFLATSSAVIIEWSWLLYLCMPLRPARWRFGSCLASQSRITPTRSW